MKAFDQTLEEMETFTQFLEEDLENIQRVVEYARKNGLDLDFEIHAKAETVEESVQHSNIDKSQIVKTLVFMGEEPVAVLCAGDKRVSEEKLERLLEEEVELASPSEVEEATGYVVGGVSPFDLDIPVYIEESVMENDMVRPAAGSRLVGAKLSPEKLKEVTDGETADIAGE
ncbi:MAG: YbaK/EbsC family protein [Candidatus Nanohaloarchaea archaeon]